MEERPLPKSLYLPIITIDSMLQEVLQLFSACLNKLKPTNSAEVKQVSAT